MQLGGLKLNIEIKQTSLNLEVRELPPANELLNSTLDLRFYLHLVLISPLGSSLPDSPVCDARAEIDSILIGGIYEAKKNLC